MSRNFSCPLIYYHQVVRELLDAFNPDRIEEKARFMFKIELSRTPSDEQFKEAQDVLIKQAASTFTGELNTFIENVRKVHEQNRTLF